MWTELIDNIDAVIFDLDGTVVDSMWIWKQIDIDYFDKYNKTFPEDYQDLIEGMSFYETAVYTKKTYDFEDSVEEMMAEWNEMAKQKYANEVMPKENVVDFLKYLQKHNKKIGIASSNSYDLCMEVLDNRDLTRYFDEIRTIDSNMPGKPDPAVYKCVAEKLAVKPEKCLIFEDLCNGIMAGKNAGMITVAIWDNYSKDRWEEKKSIADYNIMSYSEIVDEIYK